VNWINFSFKEKLFAFSKMYYSGSQLFLIVEASQQYF
jgi:hypothetical protein